MKGLDDVQIHCPRKAHTMAQSVHLNEHKPTRHSTELMNYHHNSSNLLRSDDWQNEESVELHKTHQLKTLLGNINKKEAGKSRKKVSILRPPKQDKLLGKSSEQRSTEFTKRKASKKKKSSVSNDKGQTVDYFDQSIKLLKHQLKIKQSEVKFFRNNLERVESLAEAVHYKASQTTFQSFESVARYLRDELQCELLKTFPAFAKLINAVVFLIEQPVSNTGHKNSNWSNLHTQAPLTPISLDPGIILRKDIQYLEEKLQLLKQQYQKLRKTTPTNSQIVSKLKHLAKQQDNRITQILQMEQIMEQNNKRINKSSVAAPILNLKK